MFINQRKYLLLFLISESKASEQEANDKPNLEGKSKSAVRSESDIETKKATTSNNWQSTRKGNCTFYFWNKLMG